MDVGCHEKVGWFVNKQMDEHDGGRQGSFDAQVTHSNKNCISRNLREDILTRTQGVNYINIRSKWYQSTLPCA